MDGFFAAGGPTRAQAARAWTQRNRRVVFGRLVMGGLDRVMAGLVEALGDGEVGEQVWRLAASRVGRLLVVLGRGAAGMGRPMPPEVAEAAAALRAWSVSARRRPAALPALPAPPPVAGGGGGRVRVVDR